MSARRKALQVFVFGVMLLLGTAASAAPTATLSAPANNALYHAPADVTLQASASAPAPDTVARVEFYANGALVGSDTKAAASVVWTGVTAGSYTLYARAIDNHGVATNSAVRTIRINAANTPPTVTLGALPNRVVLPATIALTVAAGAPEVNDTIAKVEFFANGSPIGTVTSAPYTLRWVNPAAGSYTLTVMATDALGGTTTASWRPLAINAAPAVTLAANPTLASAPANTTLTATATDSDGTIAKVEFLQGATVIATRTAEPYTFTVNNLAAGSYSFTARATDNLGAVSTSTAATVTVTAAAATIYYIYPDQINTPRAITNEAATTIWKWDNVDPFGANAPDEDPDGDSNRFVFNLRFPGQYFDKETGTHYNYFRDYDPAQGRYVESDPIGIKGGNNTYAYVKGNPIDLSDPNGLLSPQKHRDVTNTAIQTTSFASCGGLRGLPQKVVGVDQGTQNRDFAVIHGMRPWGTSLTQGYTDLNNYISENDKGCDLDSLARILHAEQDYAVHQMAQYFGSLTTAFGDLPIVGGSHIYNDAFPSASAINNAITTSRSYILKFMRRCPCLCQ